MFDLPTVIKVQKYLTSQRQTSETFFPGCRSGSVNSPHARTAVCEDQYPQRISNCFAIFFRVGSSLKKQAARARPAQSCRSIKLLFTE